MTGQKSIKKNTVYNAVKTISSILFPLITFPYVSRILLPENIGKVNFASTYVSYFSLIAGLGVTTYAIRECSAVRDNTKSLSNTASQIFSINMCTTLLSYVILALTLLFARSLDSYRTLIVISSSTILFSTFGADWLNSAMEDFKYIALRTIGFQVISMISLFVFVKTQDDYIKYTLIGVISSSGVNVLNAFYRRRYCNVGFVRHIDWKKHLPPIMLLFVMILSQQILVSTDITMLGLMRNNYEVGIYSTAMKILNIVSQMIYSILWVLLPRLAAYSAGDKEKERNDLLRKALCYLVGFGFPCIVGLLVSAGSVIFIFAGTAYMEAAPILMILMGSFLFDLIGGSFIGNLIMLPAKNEKYFLYACLESAVVNVILNYIFIPKYGMYAAALATVISRAVGFVSLMIHVDKRIKIDNIMRVFIAPIIGCVAIVVIAIIVSRLSLVYWVGLIVTVTLAVISYVLVLWLFKYDFIYMLMIQISEKLHR